MFEVWDKEKILHLSLLEKEQWFDVYNHKLEEDRGISLSDPNLTDKQQIIKDDYFKYIESFPFLDNVYKYYVLKVDDKIVSLCRVNIDEDRFVLEGLETHRDDYRKGYAFKLIDYMLLQLYKDGLDSLYSEARVWNDASNNLQLKIGFKQYGKEGNNFLYKIDVRTYIETKKLKK